MYWVMASVIILIPAFETYNRTFVQNFQQALAQVISTILSASISHTLNQLVLRGKAVPCHLRSVLGGSLQLFYNGC